MELAGERSLVRVTAGRRESRDLPNERYQTSAGSGALEEFFDEESVPIGQPSTERVGQAETETTKRLATSLCIVSFGEHIPIVDDGSRIGHAICNAAMVPCLVAEQNGE